MRPAKRHKIGCHVMLNLVLHCFSSVSASHKINMFGNYEIVDPELNLGHGLG